MLVGSDWLYSQLERGGVGLYSGTGGWPVDGLYCLLLIMRLDKERHLGVYQ